MLVGLVQALLGLLVRMVVWRAGPRVLGSRILQAPVVVAAAVVLPQEEQEVWEHFLQRAAAAAAAVVVRQRFPDIVVLMEEVEGLMLVQLLGAQILRLQMVILGRAAVLM